MPTQCERAQRVHSNLATMMHFSHFFLSSCVNSKIGNHVTHFKSYADDIKSLCRGRQVRKGPNYFYHCSNCDATYQCTCNEGFYPSDDHTSCILRTITDNCTQDVDCSAAVAFSFCSNGTLKCDCISGYRVSVKK